MGLMSKTQIACVWDLIPDDIILHVFSFLPASSLLKTAQVCRIWYRVTRDELLWKDLFYRHYKIDRLIPMAPGQSSWLNEYKRLHFHTPAIESETIRQHTDQVLHVSFSHNGKMFATSSKDGYIKVWNTSYPVSLKYKENMKRYTWKYTQFSQFNESDTLLLVSGVHFGSNSTSGEIAVFSLHGQFELQARVINKPYDVFGTWYNDSHLISGTLHWTGQLQSCSVLWINKAFQDTDNEHESVVMRLYKLKNINASSVRTVMVATYRENVDSDEKDDSLKRSKRNKAYLEKPDNGSSSKYARKNSQQKVLGNIHYEQEYRDAEKSCNDYALSQEQMQPDRGESFRSAAAPSGSHKSSYVNTEGKPDLDKLAEKTTKCVTLTSESSETSASYNTSSCCTSSSNKNNSASQSHSHCSCDTACSCHGGMYLDGSSFGAPIQSSFFSSFDHKVALDDWNPTSPLHKGDPSMNVPDFLGPETENLLKKGRGKIMEKFLIFTQGSKTYTPHQVGIKKIMPLERLSDDDAVNVLPDIEFNSPALESVQYDSIDKVIDMHGHIIGLALSPDHRYLYVNCRPWPRDYDIQNPLQPPPIAQEIDIHVIDLLRLAEVGTMYRAHKAYTPNDECFFIFLDVSQKYVASGAEDKHGYVWDRHYGVCLNRFRHDDVVNCVAFNPADSEILVTVSDDCTIKIWRSLNREKNKFSGFF